MVEEYNVSSEIYSEYNYFTQSKPQVNSQNIVSIFPFKLPAEAPQTDSDGDLILTRRNSIKESSIKIEHSKSTIVDLVGLQVWRGALLLADFMLHNRNNFDPNKSVLELGSGVGLTGIVVSTFAPVVCTDINKGEILQLIENNVQRNKHLSRYPVQVLELDFLSGDYSPEIERSLSSVQAIIAADVVYDDKITKALVDLIGRLIARINCPIYLALEKRFVFTLADCDTVAPCYEYFLECMSQLENVRMESVNLDFPQYFQYDRVKELVLWKIVSK